MKKLVALLLVIPAFAQASLNKPPKNGGGLFIIENGIPTKVTIPAELAPIAAGDVNRMFGDPSTPGFARDLSASSSFYSMVKDSSGNLYVCGYGNNGGVRAWIVAKYDSAGVLVTAFNTTGYVQEDSISTAGQNSEARGLTLTPDGTRIIVAGYSIPTGTSKVWTVIKYNSTSGARDTTFNTTGLIQETELGVSEAYSVSIDSAGTNLYVGGYTTPSSVTVITTISYVNATGARNAAYNP